MQDNKDSFPEKEADTFSFLELELDDRLLRAVQAAGFDTPTEIQRKAVPIVMDGSDLMASAQTGTGKTAAFVLPALHRLLDSPAGPGQGPRVLVLTPTRELANQVAENIQTLGRFTQLRFGSVTGGLPYPPQIRMLARPLDILVATPGRLIDHMQRERVDFGRLEMLILDEADRMLDMGFIDDVKAIASAAPADRQTLLFSATLEGKVGDVARGLLKDPARIQVNGVKQPHTAIEQHIHQADNFNHKKELLSHLLSGAELSLAVIFTSTKRGADELAQQLRGEGHASAPLHGDMNQGARKRTIEAMRRGKYRLLVATDVAARGLDIKGLSHVINFDLPMAAEDYVHRIGRTGRGGASGVAISLVGPDDWGNLARIERLLGRPLERCVVPGLEPRNPEPKGFQPSRKPGKRGQHQRRGGTERAHKPGAQRPAKVAVRYRKSGEGNGRGPRRTAD